MDIKRIKARLAELNMTQEDLAKRSGVSREHISKMLGGHRSANSYTTVALVAGSIGLYPQDVIGPRDFEPPSNPIPCHAEMAEAIMAMLEDVPDEQMSTAQRNAQRLA